MSCRGSYVTFVVFYRVA